MPQDAAPTVAVGTEATEPRDLNETPAFPADSHTLALNTREFAAGGIFTARVPLRNPHHTVLHVRLRVTAEFSTWLSVVPGEVALGPGESQPIAVRADTEKARTAVRAGASPNGFVELAYQRFFPASRGVAPLPPELDTLQVRLPFATCPACKRSLEPAIASGEVDITPELCPYCFERLRPCPVCGTLNSWLARFCIQDSNHMVRPGPDWTMLGGDAAHTGSVPERATPTLVRRWSFPTVPPTRREAALIWSAPVAAYGLVAASASTYDGEAHLYAFDAVTGAPLWDPYALPDPVYPDRGGCALAAGRLYAATVEGVCVCLDVQRGTRLWETSIRGRVYGSVTIAREHDTLLVAAIHEGAGILYFLDAVSGKQLRQISLPGPSDTAPAFADGLAFIHDDSGTLSAIDVTSSTLRWSVNCAAGFDSAPVVRDGYVFSLTSGGAAWCHETETGNQVWQMAVTNAPFSGTPAHDGTLIYMPANDGLHLFSASAGKPVRRYPMKMPIRSAPVVLGGTLFFGATDGNIYGAVAGRPLERIYETVGIGAQFVSAPAFSDGTFFVTSTNGVLYALSLVPPLPPTPGGVPVGS